MKFSIMKSVFSFLIFHFSFFAAAAQQTQAYINPEQAFNSGIELFDEKNYLAAREKFELIFKQSRTATSHSNSVLMQNLEYYIVVCAVETNDKDAEQLLLNYIKKHHETDKRRLIYFWLGSYYFNNKQYSDAIAYFTKVQISDLNNDQLYDYRFRLAYACFTKKKFAEAKPLFASIKDISGKYFYPSTYYYAFICFYTKDYNQALASFTKIEDSKMYAAVIPYYIAQIYYFKNDYDKVIAYITKNLTRTEVLYKDEMKILLAQVYFQKSEYTKALPLLDEYVSRSSKAGKEHIYMLAYCQYKAAEYPKAIENFKQLNLLNDKMGHTAAYALGDCYLKTGQKSLARSAFQSAAAMDFDPAIRQNALFNYAKLSFELGYSTEAIRSLESYINNYPTGTHLDEANELLAAVLVQTKNYERAYKIMESMKSKSAMLKEAYQKVTYFRAIELFNDKKYTEALALCEKSLANALDVELQALAIYLKAEILYIGTDYDAARQNYLRFAQYATPALEKKGEASKLRANYNTAYCYFKQKNYTDAALYFSAAISDALSTPDTKGKTSLLPDLYLRYGDCSFITKRYTAAVDAYDKIVSMKWANADYAQYQKGIALGLINRDDEKIDALNSLINKYPGSPYAGNAAFEVGETYLQNGSYDEARGIFQKIISKNISNASLPKAYIKIAIIDYNTGKKEQSLEGYKSVIRKFPESDEAKQSLEALKDIYVELGRADEYFEFAKNNSNINISTTEQDSLTYQSADIAYMANDCNKAITLFGNYLTKFPQGFFASEAHWKKADCHIRSKDFASALSGFEAIILNKYSRYYEKAALKASGIAYYELSDYPKANNYYQQLYLASSSSQNTYTAITGLLRTSVKLQKTDDIIAYADLLLNSPSAKDADLQEAHYEKAKAHYSKGNKESAFQAYNRVTEMPVSEKAVEAKYMAAKILFEQADYKNSLDTCFRLKNKYSSYEYWVAKTFILMADNYYAQGNTFQAKATLESIVQNYEGDETVLTEAKTKLEKIRTEELNKSKIMQVVPSDTLFMEPDTLINDF